MNGLAGTDGRVRLETTEIKLVTAIVTAIVDIDVVRFLLRKDSRGVAIGNGKRHLEVGEEGKN